jgi:hypothetical protein
MKSDIISSSESDLPTRETGLPDFAQRVLGAAREELRHRQRRHRIAAAVTMLLLGVTIPLALFTHARRDNLTSRQSVESWIWQDLPSDDSLAYQLGQSTTPPDADDYLLPHAHELTWFAFTYSDASWQYDPGWTDNR